MTESEVAKDFSVALEKVRQGLEVVVEDGHQAIAVLSPAIPPRRTISEVLARIPKDSTATMDASFARDVEAAIEGHREPLEPPLPPSGWGRALIECSRQLACRTRIQRSQSR
jgi:antitoxin (DNA-binding transcriptional repressor) of toxin-antitoxin stability system